MEEGEWMKTWQSESSLSRNTITYKHFEQECALVTLHPPEHLHVVSSTPLHHLISLQVTRIPGMLAVVHKTQSLTYAQLECQANQLAHALLHRKIGLGVCVGVYLPHSIDLLIALLAICKTGGHFILLELASGPSLALAQLAYSKVSLVLSHEKISKQLASYRADFLCLDRDQFLWIGESSSVPLVSCSAEQNACIMYCSDVIYQSKSVSLSHKDIVHLLYWNSPSFPSEVSADVAAFSPLCFDMSILTFFRLLCQGDTVIIG
jgi:non-ribosomal peptide synthetase component F